MKHKPITISSTILIVLFLGISLAAAQEPGPEGNIGAQAAVGTSFTYQGRLTDGGSPANGAYDFQFELYDASSGGNQVGATITRDDVAVSQGLFTVELDFGNVFDGTALWLAIGVRPGSSGGAYTALTPLQPLTPAPYAHSLRPGIDIEGSVNSGGILNVTNSSGGGDGLRVDSAGDDGLQVTSADDNGIYVYEAGDDGVYVYSTGSPSTMNPSTQTNGFEVAGADGDGLHVGRADDNGVYVYEAGNDGVAVASASRHGLNVSSAGQNGLYVHSATLDGVYVNSADDDGVVVYSAGDYAGYFNGDVNIMGALSKSSGSFKIDHPLDPENRYLYHSFVESPDMMNVYNGNVTLDAGGEAWITLPDWFEALNRDFRYQLTPIGGPGPNLYIAQEIAHNRFQIAGGAPGMKVSWQVTGIRHDPYAEANRIQVEEEKPAEERGVYLHPEVYGQPETMGLAYREAQANADHGAGQPDVER